MGPGIVIPVAVLVVVVPLALTFTRRRFKEVAAGASVLDRHSGIDPSVRLTSNALRAMPAPPWRVVHEVAPERLGGVDHVVIGPPGVFAVTTSMDPLPASGVADHTAIDNNAVTAAAIVRGEVDDALRRCAMTTEKLVVVHWGVNPPDSPISCDPMPGVTAVDGRSVVQWAESLTDTRLTPAQVDLAWQTVVTSIGRPDPLA